MTVDVNALANGRIKSFVVPTRKALSVVNDLTDDATAGFRIPPQLALEQDNASLGGDKQVVDISAGGRWQLQADRNDRTEARFKLVNGQRPGVSVKQSLEPCLVVR